MQAYVCENARYFSKHHAYLAAVGIAMVSFLGSYRLTDQWLKARAVMPVDADKPVAVKPYLGFTSQSAQQQSWQLAAPLYQEAVSHNWSEAVTRSDFDFGSEAQSFVGVRFEPSEKNPENTLR